MLEEAATGGSLGVSMNGHGTIGTLPDLGAVHARQQEKERVPTHDPGTPEFAKQVRVALGPNACGCREPCHHI